MGGRNLWHSLFKKRSICKIGTDQGLIDRGLQICHQASRQLGAISAPGRTTPGHTGARTMWENRMQGFGSRTLISSSSRLSSFGTSLNRQARRTYLHFRPIRPEDWELPEETMPVNISEIMKKDPRELDFFENYWYWKIRSEATVLDPENLPKKSYRQLIFDMGMQTINEKNEHLVGLLELYEYTAISPMVGPFGTLENPVIIPSVCNERIVCCTGGSGDNEHYELYFRLREGFLYRCGECDQIYMLVRVMYTLPEGVDPFPVDPDINDVFDLQLLERGQKMWNIGEYVYWPAGNLAYKRAFMEGEKEFRYRPLLDFCVFLGEFGNDIPALEGNLPIPRIGAADEAPRIAA